MMNLNDYQRQSRKFAIYQKKDANNFIYPLLGLLGESGEIAEKMKRVLREDKDPMEKITREEIIKELGDVLWYIAQLSTELQVSLEEVAKINLIKLSSRKKRNKLKGEGDNR